MKRVKRWITLTVCTLLFVGSVSAAISPEDDDEVNVVGVHKRHTKSASRARKRSSPDAGKGEDVSIPASAVMPGSSGAVPNTRANSVMVVDARTGAVLHEKNADQPRPAASTQKLLTALIIAETGYLDRPVRVEPIDTFAEPVRLNIRPGEVYQRIDLLRALLVKSPNDVARCLARDSAGSIEAFADRMNAKAQLLGATHSHFVNPNGLPMPGQYSTARDLAIIARAAPASFSLRQRSDPRTGKHEQGFETASLLQRHENRLHRSGWSLSHCERFATGARRHRCCPGRHQIRGLDRRRFVAFLGSLALIEGVARVSRAAGRIFVSGERRRPACWPRQPTAAPSIYIFRTAKNDRFRQAAGNCRLAACAPRNPRRSRW